MVETPAPDRPLRIGLIAPPWFSVPPAAYGGIELVVAILADGLVAAGHDVTLFASGGSETSARLVSVYERPPSERIGQTLTELRHVAAAVHGAAGRLDVLHDHSGFAGAALVGQAGVPACHTVHGPLTQETRALYRTLAALDPTLRLISISRRQRAPDPALPWLANCPNGLRLDDYPLAEEKEDYLVFLGRMAPEKGCREAVQVARAVGRPLRIAAKAQDGAELLYFEEEIAPLLGGDVEFLGELGHAAKVELLGRAACMLFPIDWEEPFGLVMIEAMACGTPVLATARGSVPEVVSPGRSGVVVDDWRDMPAALEDALRIDAASCRAHVADRFSVDRVVRDHVEAYRRLLDEAGDPSAVAPTGPATTLRTSP